MFEVTIKFETQDALVAYFVGQGGVTAEKVDAPQAAPVKAPTPGTAASLTSKGTTAAASKEIATPSKQVEAAAEKVAETLSTSTETEAVVTYPELQKAVFALANANREAASEVAASFGVKTFKELGEDKWPAALAAVNAKLVQVKS